MRVAQKVLMIVAEVVSVILAFCLSFAAIPALIVIFGAKDGTTSTGAWILVICWLGMVVNAFIAIFARNTKNKVLLVLNIIFGILSYVILNAVGGIIGLVANANEKK